MIGADRYERTEDRITHRNGSRPRLLSTKAGDVELAIPKLRQGSFFPALLEPRRRIDRALWAVIMEAFVHGVSTRKVDDLVPALGHRRRGSPRARCSRICAELDVPGRPSSGNARLDHIEFPYVFLDATYVKAHDGAAPSCPRPSSWPPGWPPTATGRCWAWPWATPRTRRSGPRSCAGCAPGAWPGCAWSSPTPTRGCKPPSTRSCSAPPGNAAGSTSCATCWPRCPRAHRRWWPPPSAPSSPSPTPPTVADQLATPSPPSWDASSRP